MTNYLGEIIEPIYCLTKIQCYGSKKESQI